MTPAREARKRTPAGRPDGGTSIATRVKEALAWLERRGSKKNRDGMARYAIVTPKVFGVPMNEIQQLGKRLGRDQALAESLFDTGWYEAKLLAAYVAEPDRISPAMMDRWVKTFDNWAVCDTLCFHLFDRTPHAWKKVTQWSGRREEFVRRAGFALLASLSLHDKKADDGFFLNTLPLIEKTATDDRNFVKKAVNWSLRSLGRRNAALNAAARACAQRLAESSDATARWIGRDALREFDKVAKRIAAKKATPARSGASRAMQAILLALVCGVSAACGNPEEVAGGRIGDFDGTVAIDVSDVFLNPENPSETAVGRFEYAGGFAMSSSQTEQLHGLSDLEIRDTVRVTAVGDFGTLLEATLVLDGDGRLTGIQETRLTPLLGVDGLPVPDKTEGDAEGLAILPNGDRLVSFERHHRILLYPAGSGPARDVPTPQVQLPENNGLEALAADPERGADAYIAGAEMSGVTWTCRTSQPCVQAHVVEKPQEFGLVAIRRLTGNRTAYLLRAYDEDRGNRISLQIFAPEGLVDRMDMARPMTVDNFEGLATVPLPGGGYRFYLLSDDNDNATQRTLLMAFDWRGEGAGEGR